MRYALLTATVIAAGAVASGRFINQAGAYPAAGGLPIGCAQCDGVAGDPLPVDVIGITDAVSGAAVAKDDPLMLDAAGRVVPHDGTAGKHAVGRAMQAAAGADQPIEILLAIGAGDTDAVV